MRIKKWQREERTNLAAFADYHGDGGGKIEAFLDSIGDEIESGTKEERTEEEGVVNGPSIEFGPLVCVGPWVSWGQAH